MPSSPSIASVALALCLSAWGARAPAQSAQSASAAPPSSEARAAFREGVDASNHARWDDAVRAFTRAYALEANPLILYNLAVAQASAGLLRASAESYQRFLRDATAPPASDYRDRAQAGLATLQRRIPRVRLATAALEPGDEVRLDGVPVAQDALAGEIAVDPGAHAAALVRRGAEVVRVEFEAQPGEVRRVALGAGTADALRVRPSPPRRERQPVQAHAAFPWAWTVVGAVLVVGAAVTVGVVLSQTDPFHPNATPPRLEF